MPSAIFYDSNGAIHMVCGGTPDQATPDFFAANAPAGTTVLEVDDSHPALASPHAWSVKRGQLVQKTQVSIAVSGKSLTVSGAGSNAGTSAGAAVSLGTSTPASPTAINTTVYIGGNPIAVKNGAATLTSAAPPGTRIQVDPLDPNYWSPAGF